MKTYQTMITKEYCPDWSAIDGIREWVANALDSESEMNFTYQKCPDGTFNIFIESPDTILSHDCLLLGVSSNRNDKGAVGTHGEGMVVAMGVVIREGLEVVVSNGPVHWIPNFSPYKDTTTEVVTIEETDKDECIRSNNSFEVCVKGLSLEQFNEVKKRCLYLQDPETLGEVLECDMGKVFLEKSGKLYVGGIFVKKTPLNYTYDFNPEYLKLNRDRQSVDDWDLGIATTKLWDMCNRPEEVADMISKGNIEDINYAQYSGVSKEVKVACFNIYKEKYEGKVLAVSNTEKENLTNEGYSNIIVDGSTNFTNIVKSTEEYKSLVFDINEDTPLGLLEDVLEDLESRRNVDQASYEIKELIKTFKTRGVRWG